MFGITSATLLVEIFTGIWSGSLALISDSVHVAIDLVAVIIAIKTEQIVRTKQSAEAKTRAIGGLISGSVLGLSLVYILVEAIKRILEPPELLTTVMIAGALAGLIGNLGSVWILHKSEETHLTHQALHLHVLSDCGQSFGVVAAGFCIWLTGWRLIDPLTSLGIACLLTSWSYRLIRKSLRDLRLTG